MARKVSEEVWIEMTKALASAKGHTAVILESDSKGMTALKQALNKQIAAALDLALKNNVWVPSEKKEQNDLPI